MSWRHIITFNFVYADAQQISDARILIKADFDRRYDLIPITAGSRVAGFTMFSKDLDGISDQLWVEQIVERLHSLHPTLWFVVTGAWEFGGEHTTWVWEVSKEGIKIIRGKPEKYDG